MRVIVADIPWPYHLAALRRCFTTPGVPLGQRRPSGVRYSTTTGLTRLGILDLRLGVPPAIGERPCGKPADNCHAPDLDRQHRSVHP